MTRPTLIAATAASVIAASLITLAPAAATQPDVEQTSPPSMVVRTVSTGTGTPRAVKLAERLAKRIERRQQRQRQRRGWAHSSRHVSHYRALPKSIKRGIAPGQLRPLNKNRNIRSVNVRIETGRPGTTACVRLASKRAQVVRDDCYAPSTPDSGGLVAAYRVLVSHTIWLDQRHRVYGFKAGDVRTLRKVAKRELPAGWRVGYSDHDGDGRVDDGKVIVWNGTSCGLVYLPDHSPSRTGYVGAMIDCRR